jgi:MSHA biogenesis protein MshO
VAPGDQQAVTYACLTPGVDANGDGTGTLMRYWAYGFNAALQPLPPGGSSALLADRVSACEMTYNIVNQRNGLVEIRLGISRGGESISLYHSIHVNNVP